MNMQQPKPDSKHYSDLISDIQKGIIKIPKFQREFVWSIDKTAQLLDSILKGYPIGTFILWQTGERMADVKNIGNLDIPEPPEGQKVQYVLDGQQRITSLYAAYCGAKIRREGEKKVTDYTEIYIDLEKNLDDDDAQVITSEKPVGSWISLSEILHLRASNIRDLQKRFSDEDIDKITSYSDMFKSYDFSVVLLRKESIESAIEVFTRINTGGQTLTLFEIMSAKTYDDSQGFDMEDGWSEFCKKLADKKYDGINSSTILSLLSLVLSPTKECKRKTILALDKQDIIDTWDSAISAIEESIDYFRTSYGIPVSQLLPYDVLLVPFGYFFHKKKDKPDGMQRRYLEEFFWRACLSFRYSSSTESSLAQDIKRIDLILSGERPKYEDVKLQLNGPDDLINMEFRAGNSYCKAIMCLLAAQEPKDFQDNSKVLLDNSWLKQANSKNYHHFFPKDHLKKRGIDNANSLMNITLVSDRLNKRKIRARAPSEYIEEFYIENEKIEQTLATHFIDYKNSGIESDDYSVFLQRRAEKVFSELKNRIDLLRTVEPNSDIHEMILNGETDKVEFKQTLRFDTKKNEKNTALEYVVIKTIAGFLNEEGGTLVIGVKDKGEPVGLEDDFKTLSKPDADGFQLHLTQLCRNHIGSDLLSHIKITFPEIEEKILCVVRVSKCSRSVITKSEGREDYFVREGNSTRGLTREEQSKHEQKRRA